MQRKHWIGLSILALGLLGGGYYWFNQTPDEEPVVEDDEDMTREQTEALMRQIGYVQ